MSNTPSHVYTVIWQSATPHESEWVDEIFGPYVKDHVTDTKHEVVLDNAILIDAFLDCHDIRYYERFRGKNSYLVHFLDENFEGRYQEIYSNFRGVFRCFWADVFNTKYVMKLPLGYCNGMSGADRTIPLATERKYLWSFAGQLSKSSRPDMAKALLSIEPHFLFSTDNVPGLTFFNNLHGKPKRLAPADFSELLLQSIFSPCPMGNVNAECFRLYEALECGSIPIVEKRMTLDYYRDLLGEHPIPTVRSWGEARSLIQKLLRNPDEMNTLQQRCVKWWEAYKATYREEVGDFLSTRMVDTAPINAPIMTKKYSMPGWRVLELLRHHDANAFFRRVNRQTARLLKQGKLRVAHRPAK
jgi:hypothetical protein